MAFKPATFGSSMLVNREAVVRGPLFEFHRRYLQDCRWPASAATCAHVSSSAPNATKLTSPSIDLRAMYTGPVNSRPLAVAVLPSVMNTTFSAVAPIDACQGNPFSLVAMISWAVAPGPGNHAGHFQRLFGRP